MGLRPGPLGCRGEEGRRWRTRGQWAEEEGSGIGAQKWMWGSAPAGTWKRSMREAELEWW
jgi:hypothetical protein